VLLPPRDQTGALCPSDEWRLEIFLNDHSNNRSTAVLDAIFPQQFDNHICTIDASGVIKFWDIYGGDTTSVITGIHHVQMLCFGSEKHSRFGAFLLAPNQLFTLFPVAPRQCCASQGEVLALKDRCVDGLNYSNSNETREKWEIPLRWLYATFPYIISIPSMDSSEASRSSFSWIEGEKQSNFDHGPPLSKSFTLNLRGSSPLQMIARHRDTLTILLIATDDGHVDVILCGGDIFMPAWRIQASFVMHHVESLFVVDAVDEAAVCLETSGYGIIYYVIKHDVTTIHLLSLIETIMKHKDAFLDIKSAISKSRARCSHTFISPDPHKKVVTSGLLGGSASHSATMLCWFDDWSCCAIDVSANHYVPSELVRSEIQHSSNDMLHLVAELTTVVDDVNNAFGRLAIFTSCRKTFIWLNDIREYLEFDVTLPITDYTRRSMAVADALCLICSRRFPQLRSANKTMNVEPVKKSDSNLEGIFDSV